MTRADVDRLAASGFNSIRLPMHYNLFTLPIEEEPVKGKDTWLTAGFEMTDNLLAWCRANRMYLILDLHAAPGGQGKDANISDYDPAKPSLWESEENRRKTVALWRKLAERYANEPWIGGYDILNEPNWTFEGKDKNGREDVSNQPIWDLYKAITRAIREVDAKHLIIVEGNGWGNNYGGFPEPWDRNLVMSFHKYWNPNTEEAIARFLALREQYRLPDLARRERREHQRVVPGVCRPGREARNRMGMVAVQEAHQPAVHHDGDAAGRLQEDRGLLERRRRAPVCRGRAPGHLRTGRAAQGRELPLQRRRGAGADSGRRRGRGAARRERLKCASGASAGRAESHVGRVRTPRGRGPARRPARAAVPVPAPEVVAGSPARAMTVQTPAPELQPIVLGPHQFRAIGPLEPADDEVAPGHVLEVVDEEQVDRGPAGGADDRHGLRRHLLGDHRAES